MWSVAEIWPGELECQHVAYHRLVREWSQQDPVVVLAHTEQGDFLFLPSFLDGLLESLEAVWLLVRFLEGGVATIFQSDIALIVDPLVRIGYSVPMIETSCPIIHNLHSRCYPILSRDTRP